MNKIVSSYRRQAMFSWLFVVMLFVLCGVLGILQYTWIGEVSVSLRERLQSSLQDSLYRLSRAFDAEIMVDCRALLPPDLEPDTDPAAQLEARYAQWKKTTRHGQLFRRVGIAIPRHDTLVLQILDAQTGTFGAAIWPASWETVRGRLQSRLRAEPWREGGQPRKASGEDGMVFEVPLFTHARPAVPPMAFGRGEAQWLLFEVDIAYVRDRLLPELIQHHLGAGGSMDYQIEVVKDGDPAAVIYESDPGQAEPMADTADASVSLFAPQFDPRPRPARAGDRMPAPPGPGRGPQPAMGRWRMYVRHRAGSLEALVARTRWRNLGVTAGVWMLMVASVGALIRFTRCAQKLVELQMDFVAGVSHELRTPLTVIHTAAYNLRGKVAGNPSQVERYGVLIQEESGRLKELVEQVLQFARSRTGRVIQDAEPISIESVIEDTIRSSRSAIGASRCVVEKNIEPELPLVLGDPVALKHAFQNLLSNAAKYGTAETHWIGVFASRAGAKDHPAVEIRVADRGPGIPQDEQEHIFDPFFRGRRAVQDQLHGTGLGLNLVKKIVEAHGGNIRVKSEPMKGAEFIVRIPAAPVGAYPTERVC